MNLKFWETFRKPHTAPSEPPAPLRGILMASTQTNRLTNTREVMEKVPLRFFAQGQISEADLALAATTPVLGQYAPQFGWPDDWGLYWDYMDAYLFIPEVAFAVKLKTRMIWKPGFELEASEAVRDKILKLWKTRKIGIQLKQATKNALIWGNAYCETVDDSEAEWEQGPGQIAPLGTALGALGPRPLKKWKPASVFYGLKQIDPRTMRVFIDPQKFDVDRAESYVEKYIQRRWAGPLGPTPATLMQSNVEIDFHPDQIVHLRFNRLPGGIYGYSMYRESIYALKAYAMMLQYLPAIVERHANPLLHFILGKEKIIGEDGRERTYIPPKDEYDRWKTELLSRQPHEDIYTDILTTIDEVYKGREGPLPAIQQYIQAWKERILIGLGIPSTLFDLVGVQPGEVKWGNIKFEVLEDEVREYQDDLEDVINNKVLPRLAAGDAELHFKEITPEDWRANVSPLLDLYKNQVVSSEYIRDRLNLPEEAGKGTMYVPQAGSLLTSAK